MVQKSKVIRRVPIVKLCEVHVDCVNRTAPVVDFQTPYKMIRTTNVRDGFIDTENVRYVTEQTYKKWTRRLIPKRDDVIVTREAPLGEVGKIRTDDQIFLGQRLYQFRTNPQKLDANFLLYSLLGDDLQGQIRSYGSGATVEHMRLEDIPSLEISLPPIEEQHKIASILSAYDELIENNTRRIKILEEMAQSIYREWFVNYRFPGHQKVKMVDSPLGMIPEGWEVKKLGDFVVEMRDSVNPKSVDSTTPYIGLEHVPRKSLFLIDYGNASQVDSTKLFFSEGDILFGKIRPYFHKVVISHIKGICSTDILVIRPIQDLFHGLVSLTVFSEDFVNFSSQTSQGTKMPRANWNVLSKYPVPNPSEDLLIEFSKITDDLFKLSRKLILANFQLRQTRDLLLPLLISGQVNVTDLDIQVPED